MPETDLYAPVKRFLERQGYVVKGEIGACDVVAVRGDEPPVIVELKRGFSIGLLLQGVDRQSVTDAVYLAIPRPKRAQLSGASRLCKRLGLGLLVVAPRGVEALADPAPYRPRSMPKRRALLLKEFARRVGDTETGGSAARRPRMTSYRQDALRLAAFIADGTAKVAACRSATGVERAGAMLLADVYGWFSRRGRGVYALSAKGQAALVEYAAAVATLDPPQRLPAGMIQSASAPAE